MTNPVITVIVPNYNGANTIARTLDSLLSQDYHPLNIIVADGGSTDGSLDIVGAYSSKISLVLKGPDNGQSHAINKAYLRSSPGGLISWLCSDDILTPGALHSVASAYKKFAPVDVITGAGIFEYAQRGRLQIHISPREESLKLLAVHNTVCQPSTFIRREFLESISGTTFVDEEFNFAMDMDLWCRLAKNGARWHILDSLLSISYFDGENKTTTGREKIINELVRINAKYDGGNLISLMCWQRALIHPLEKINKKYKNRTVKIVARNLIRLIKLGLAPFYGLDKVRALNWSMWI